MALVKLSGKPGAECEHLISVSSAAPYIPPDPLKEESLMTMQEKGLISSTRMTECAEHDNSASVEGICPMFPIFYEEHIQPDLFTFPFIQAGRKDGASLGGQECRLSNFWGTGIAFVKAQRSSIDVSISIWQCGGSTKKEKICN